MKVKEELLHKYPFYQPEKGYRYSLDALLLSGFVKDLKKESKVLEIGTGSGIVTLLLSKRFPEAKYHVVEIQEELYKIAVENFKLHGLEVDKRLGDYRNISEQDVYDYIISNPPFFKEGFISKNPMEAIARHELKSTLKDLIEKSKKLLKTGGFLYLVYPAARLSELFRQLEESGIKPYSLKNAHSRPGEKGELVLVAGKKGYRGSLKVLTPFYIYRGKGDYSEESEILFKEGVLKW